MITKAVLTGVRIVSSECRRNIGLMAPAMQKASDPIQQLFVDKLRDYKSKSKCVCFGQYFIFELLLILVYIWLINRNGELVDATPETKKELENELKRVAQVS